MPIKEGFRIVLNKSVTALANKAISDMCALPLSKMKKEVGKNPLSRAESNFDFLKNSISPILSRGFTKGFKIASGADFEMELCRSSDAAGNTSIVYDGASLYLCFSTGEDRKRIERQELASLCEFGGEDTKEMIITFGKMAKGHLGWKIIHAIKTNLPVAEKTDRKPSFNVMDRMMKFHSSSNSSHQN
jgi:hypothetical protein